MDVTHPQLVAALVKPPRSIIESLSDYTADLWHGATGVAGEGGELLEGITLVMSNNSTIEEGRVNVLEESGDLYFYIEQLVQRTGIELDWDAIATFARNQIISPDMMLTYAVIVAVESSKVLDTVKKAAVYNKELDIKLLTTQLTELCKYLMPLGYMFGIEHTEALRENIAKLKVRYDGLKYTDKAAQARADKIPERNYIGKPKNEPVRIPMSQAFEEREEQGIPEE
jgi:hypothetical protein